MRNSRGSAGSIAVPGAVLLTLLLGACLDSPPGRQVGSGVPPPRPPQSGSPRQADPSYLDALADDVHERINSYRASQRLPPLELDDDLSEIAREHSARMASGRVPLGHDGFEERARRIREEMAYRRIAENVGYNRGFIDPAADAVERWLRSGAHRSNVEGDYEQTGIGAAANGRGEYYFTQIFVRPAR